MVFDKQLLSAQKMLSKYGQACTLRKLATTTPDPSKPWETTSATASDASVKIAFFPNTRADNEFLHYLPGTDIPAGSEVGYLEGGAPAPTLKDLVIRGSQTLSILSVDRIAPNGEIVLYILGLGE